MQLNDLFLPNGDIAFFPEIKAVSASEERKGNVVTHRGGSDAQPSHFQVSFVCSAKFRADGAETVMAFTPTVVISGKDKDATYRQIEDEAAELLPGMLRQVADRLDEILRQYRESQAVQQQS